MTATRFARAKTEQTPMPDAPTRAWCGCGIALAGSPLQIARAAEIHWRICTEPWRLHLADPRKDQPHG